MNEINEIPNPPPEPLEPPESRFVSPEEAQSLGEWDNGSSSVPDKPSIEKESSSDDLESPYIINDIDSAHTQALVENAQRDALGKVEIDGGIEQITSDSDRKKGDFTEKSNFGEMQTDVAMSEDGWSRISENTVTSLDDPIQKGIDGVYERTNNETGQTEYCIVESKYGSSTLGEPDFEPQMGEEWIDKRLDDAVGKEKAQEIREAMYSDPDSVSYKLSHVDAEGNVNFETLNPEEIDAAYKEKVDYMEFNTDEIDAAYAAYKKELGA